MKKPLPRVLNDNDYINMVRTFMQSHLKPSEIINSKYDTEKPKYEREEY